jgi:hypothetical protein
LRVENVELCGDVEKRIATTLTTTTKRKRRRENEEADDLMIH